MSQIIVTSVGLSAVNYSSTNPIFNLAYFLPIYDARIDPDIHTGTGVISASPLTSGATSATTFDTLIGEKLWNLTGTTSAYSLASQASYIYQESTSYSTSSVGNSRRTSVATGSTVTNTTQNSPSKVNLITYSGVTKPLSTVYTDSSITGDGYGNWTFSTLTTCAAQIPDISTTANRNYLYNGITYSPEVSSGGTVQAVFKCRMNNQIGSFKFNKIAIFLQRVLSNGTVDSTYNPDLFAVAILNKTVIKTNDGTQIDNFELDVKLNFSTSAGNSIWYNSDYWTKIPDVSGYPTGLFHVGDIALGVSSVAGSWKPSVKMHITDNTKPQMALSRDRLSASTTDDTHFFCVSSNAGLHIYPSAANAPYLSYGKQNVNLGIHTFTFGDSLSSDTSDNSNFLVGSHSKTSGSNRSVILGGMLNTITSGYDNIILGSYNSSAVNNVSGSFILGGGNLIRGSKNDCSVFGGNSNTIEGNGVGFCNLHLGGSGNLLSGSTSNNSFNIIAGGYNQQIYEQLPVGNSTGYAAYNTILGGSTNKISATGTSITTVRNYILGGSGNTVGTSNNSGVIGGNGNLIANGNTFGSIIAGSSNKMTDTDWCSIVGAQSCNINGSTHTTIHGKNNTVETVTISLIAGTNNSVSNSNNSTILGNYNTNSSVNNTIGLGSYNKITGNFGSTLGNDNTAYTSAIALGNLNSVTVGDCGVALGNSNDVQNSNAVAIGTSNSITGTGTWSVAMGNNNTVTQTYATSIGKYNTVSNTYGTAIGNYNKVTGNFGTILGNDNTVSNTSAIALGNVNEVTATNGTTIGNYNRVTGVFGTSLGNSCLTTTSAISLGNRCQAVSTDSLSIGTDCVSNGVGGTSIGKGAWAGTSAITIGYYSVAASYGISVGRDNNVLSQYYGMAFGNSNTLAAGADSTNSSMALGTSNSISGAGSTSAVSIGNSNITLTNSSLSTVIGTKNVAGAANTRIFGMYLSNYGQNSTIIGQGDSTGTYTNIVNGTNSIVLVARPQTSSKTWSTNNAFMVTTDQCSLESITSTDFYSDGTTTIRSGSNITLSGLGNITLSAANGVIWKNCPGGTGTTVVWNTSTSALQLNTSTRRTKEDIRPLEIDSSKVYDLDPVNFTYKNTKQKSFGYIAEDVYNILPDLVQTDTEGKPFSVDYQLISVLLLEELKKLKKEVEELKSQKST